MARPAHFSHNEAGRWWPAIVFLTTGVALFATSAPAEPSLLLTRQIEGPPLTLTQSEPSRSVEVFVSVEGKTPNGEDAVPQTAGVSIGGELSHTETSDAGVTSDAGDTPRWVSVWIDVENEPPAETQLSALRTFIQRKQLFSRGECDGAATQPCTTTFFVHFHREDDGASGGGVDINWTLDFEARIPTDEKHASDDPQPLPWRIEVHEL